MEPRPACVPTVARVSKMAGFPTPVAQARSGRLAPRGKTHEAIEEGTRRRVKFVTYWA